MDFADDDTGYGKSKTPKVAKVKDKTPAPVQITAEQLLREAKERELELVQAPPRQKISDAAELRDYQMRKRKAFEDNIRKNRFTLSNWLKYAAWEETQKALRNARSVYERAIDVDHRAPVVWLKYADMEMRNKQVNSARNILDRAVSILPRVDQFWRKYAYMEETLNNIAGCRQVFERWMEWRPNEQAWHAYINFELRYKELDNARMIYERFVVVHPEVQNWIKYARFEEKHGYIASARRIFERANEYFGTEHLSEQFVIAFARFEENQKEHERVRTIYKWAINHFDKEKCRELYRLYTIHEKKYGDQSSIEGALVEKRKNHYEEELKSNPYNYDAWFNYIRLMEEHGNPDVVRELYERAIANIPLKTEKRYWRRYIYLWIYYAIYEELEMKDIDRARQVYKTCLDNIPHKVFTFAKIWVMFAKFEIRDKHLDIARKILGSAIGKCPKDKLFREYINLEFQLKEFGRCRTLYHKFLEFSPENCRTWIEFAEMETNLTDVERARAIYELAITQKLDMPEVMWKAYIDFETGLDEYDKVRDIYKRLLERTPHIKVWLSYALFELSTDEDCIDRSRQVYKTANKFMKERKNEERVAMQNHEEWETLKKTRDEERATLLEKWLEFENEFGDDESLAAIQKLQPRKEVRSRASKADGSTVSWEEHYEYVFPDEENTKIYSNLRAKALNYELQKAKAS